MITQQRLHEMFEYKDGNLYRKISLGRTKSGDKVGFINDKGYISVNIDKQCIALHRIVWMMQYGEMPLLIDHIDNNKQNNRIENLRLADKFQNAHNRSIHKNNTSGYKGVYWSKRTQKWKTQIMCNRKTYTLGYYKSPEEADEVVSLARDMLHGDFANHGITSLTERITALEGK
jgi:HNH endonuclease/AP2 domain